MPRRPLTPNPTLTYFRRIQGLSLGTKPGEEDPLKQGLSERMGGELSKVFLSKVERGERQASEASKRAIVAALKRCPSDEKWLKQHRLAALLLPELTVDEVFQPEWKKTPDQAFATYLLAARKRPDEGVPESEFERDMRGLGLDPDEEAASPSPVIASGVDEQGDEFVVIDFSQADESVQSLQITVSPPKAQVRPRAR